MLMAQPTEVEKLTGLASRFGAFVAEQHPFALAEAIDAFQRVATGDESDEAAIDALRSRLQRELARRLEAVPLPDGLPETTPRIAAAIRNSPALKCYFVNLMWQPGETDEFRASDHVRVLHRHAG